MQIRNTHIGKTAAHLSEAFLERDVRAHARELGIKTGEPWGATHLCVFISGRK